MNIIQQHTDATMAKMLVGKEELIKRALDVTEPAWTIAAVLHRLTRTVHVPSNIETINLDGKPIIEFYPVEFGEIERRGDRYVQQVSQNYRMLNV
jgi:hypothetical protein